MTACVLLQDGDRMHNLHVVDSGISIQPSSEQLEVIAYDSSTHIMDFIVQRPPVPVNPSEVTVASAGYSAFASVQSLQQQLL